MCLLNICKYEVKYLKFFKSDEFCCICMDKIIFSGKYQNLVIKVGNK